MEEFKKKLIGIAGRTTAYPIAFFAVAIVLAICGILQANPEEYVPFHPLKDGYASMDVTYVMGPFAEETAELRASKEFYIAETSDQMWYVMCTKPNAELPVYGEDISDADISGLTTQTVYGKSEQFPTELIPFLVDFLSDTNYGITSMNYSDYFGTHYLDATVTASRNQSIYYCLAGIIALLGLIPLFAGSKRCKKVKLQINEWEATGDLDHLYNDFTSADAIYASELRLALSPHYLLDFAAEEGGVKIIHLSEIDNVYLCNMIAGEPTTTNFIVLENEEGRYCVAKCPRKTKQFNRILEQLKTDVDREETL